MKRIFSVLLVMVFCISLTPVVANAADELQIVERSIYSDIQTKAAITNDGTLWMWGLLYRDQDISEHIATPEKIANNVASIMFVRSRAVAFIDNDGTLWMRGDGSYGALGVEGVTGFCSEPVRVLDNVVQACTGICADHSFALKSDGSVWAWGKNFCRDFYGVLGTGSTNKFEYTPQKVMDGAKMIASGNTHALALKNDGSVWAWGYHTSGAIGDGTKEDYSRPIKIMDDVVSIGAGHNASMALKTDGSLWAWGGFPASLYFIDNSARTVSTPTQIMTNVESFIFDREGSGFTVKMVDGTIKMFDENTYDPTGEYSQYFDTYGDFRYDKILKANGVIVDVSIGTCGGIYLLTDGSIWTWGHNSGGEIGNGKIDGPSDIYTTPVKIMDNVKVPGAVPVKPEPIVGKFTDVPSTAWYADSVAWALDQGITVGTSKNTFSPESTCTRGQIITFLWRAAGSPAPAGTANVVDAGNTYYSDAIRWAAEKGMFDGNSFLPEGPCTRAAVVEFLWKYAGSPKTQVTSTFVDVAPDAEYAEAVAWALENGVTSGTSKTTFSPDSTCTRGQIVTFLYRAFGNG